MSLKLYCDLMSQPSRALYILLKKVNSDFEYKYVNLRQGEHLSDDFSKLNRLQKVPVIEHNGFILSESVGIVRYLAREGIIPESLYPKESQAQARVDEFLEWHHIGLRLHLSMYFRVKQLDPIFTGKQPDPKTVASYQRRMESALETLDTKWLGRGSPFINGDSPTVADLMAATEVEQPRMAGYDPLAKFPNIATWMQRVRSAFHPHYDEAHVTLNKLVAKQAKSKL